MLQDPDERLRDIQEQPRDKSAPPLWLLLLTAPISIAYFTWMYYAIYLFTEEFWKKSKHGNPLYIVPGWINGRQMDLTDPQWNMFRRFIPLLAVAATVFLILSTLVKKTMCKNSKTPLLVYYSLIAFGFIIYLFELSAIFPLTVILINYAIGKIFKASQLTTVLTWAFNLFILFHSKSQRGYRFLEYLGSELLFLDDYRGVMPWEIYFNITFCRLVSFNIDYRDAILAQEKDSSDPVIKAEWDENRRRTSTIHNPDVDYGFLSYFAYITYLPLYIAGPVLTYNAFYSYVTQKPQEEVSLRGKILTTFQVIVYALLLDVSIHYVYCAGFNERKLWKPYSESPLSFIKMDPMSPALIATNGFATLLYMYLKFMVIWRFFRAWALWDDINPPENMTRCIINNTTVSSFWKGWHSSLNLWIVKYIYVPMGGAKRKFVSVWFIFSFIAMWHDLEMRWMAWAMINCLLFIGEIAITTFVPKIPLIQEIKQVSDHRFKPYYNILVASASTLCMVGMVVANLAIMFGFTDSFIFIKQVANGGLFMAVASFLVMFSIAQIVLYNEERKRRKGKR